MLYKRMIKQSLVYLFTVFLISRQTIAWNSFGHIAISRIAEKILGESDPDVLEKSYKILSSLHAFFPETQGSLLEAAIIPDFLNFNFHGFLAYYHYTDTPYIYKNDNPKAFADPAFPYDAGYAINAITNIIRDSLDEVKQKTMVVKNGLMDSLMFRFLLHVVGDVHQPLHSTSMFSKMLYNGKIKNGDLGGNMISVIDVFGRGITNLHSLWDSGIGMFSEMQKIPLSKDNRSTVEREVIKIMEKYPRSYFGNTINILAPQKWIEESHTLAVEVVYNDIDVFPLLTPEYIVKARTTCLKRIALAGYRLAEVLKDLLK